jgi:hypothetical protein
MIGYRILKNTKNVKNIDIIVNNNINKTYITKAIPYIYYILNVIKYYDKINVNLITLYPKLYSRKFSNNIFINLNKIVRNKKYIEYDDNIDEEIIKYMSKDIDLLLIFDKTANVLCKQNISMKYNVIYFHNLSRILCENNYKFISTDFDDIYMFIKSINYLLNYDMLKLCNTIYFKKHLCNSYVKVKLSTKKYLEYLLIDVMYIDSNDDNRDRDVIIKAISDIINKIKLINTKSHIENLLINIIYSYVKQLNYYYKNKCKSNIITNLIGKEKNSHIFNNKYYRNLDDINNIYMFKNMIDDEKKVIEDDIDEIELEYNSIVELNNHSLYMSNHTLSNWYEELMDGYCVGLNLHILNFGTLKGKYNISVNDISNNAIGSVMEMFVNLNKNNIIDIDNLVYDKNNVSNIVIPLYINEIHWRISKLYINPICNIIMYNSIEKNNKKSWKLMYIILVDLIKLCITNDRTIKYLFSYWLTMYNLSKEHKFLYGLNNYITMCRKGNISFDVNMIVGQIISIGCKIDKINMDYVKQILIKDIFEYENINLDNIDELPYINRYFSLIFMEYLFENIDINKLTSYLYKNYGILSNTYIKKINKLYSDYRKKTGMYEMIKKYIIMTPSLHNIEGVIRIT